MIPLEPFHTAHFDQLIAWAATEELLLQFAGPDFQFPLSTAQLEKYLEEPRSHAYSVMDAASGAHIGHGELFLPAPGDARLCRLIIGDPAHRGRGLGAALVRSLMYIAFTEMETGQVSLNVAEWNTGAIRCYEKEGFVVNPDKVSRRELNGRVWVSLNMILDRERYENLRRP